LVHDNSEVEGTRNSGPAVPKRTNCPGSTFWSQGDWRIRRGAAWGLFETLKFYEVVAVEFRE
jgi:hypothetical protein